MSKTAVFKCDRCGVVAEGVPAEGKDAAFKLVHPPAEWGSEDGVCHFCAKCMGPYLEKRNAFQEWCASYFKKPEPIVTPPKTKQQEMKA